MKPPAASTQHIAGLTVPPEPTAQPTSLGIHKFSQVTFATNQIERESTWIEMFTRAVSKGTLVAFIGSGCAKAYGLPDWRQLAQKIKVGAELSKQLRAENVENWCQLTGQIMQTIQDPIQEIGQEVFVQLTAAGISNVEQLAESLKREAVLPDQLNATDLPTLIGQYKKEMHDLDLYHEIIHGFLTHSHKPPDEKNPYKALLRLRVHRFITSNYDGLLEEELKAEDREFEDGEDSFAPQQVDKLTRFVMADPSSRRDMVFHCHGRIKDGTKSLILTEEDYQDRYFGPGEDRVAFRHALQLLYGSNPILFIGTSLDDEDLFRPLRAFGAINQSRRPEQLLFALLPFGTVPHRIESLYERFGVKVFTFALDHKESGEDLATALLQLQEHWEIHRRSWLEKPPIRAVKNMRDVYSYRHYGQTISPPEMHGTPSEQAENPFGKSDVDHVINLLAKPEMRVLCLVGPGGTGKTWVVNKVFDELAKECNVARKPDRKVFFWSSYYSGDCLSGLDRALALLEDKESYVNACRDKRIRSQAEYREVTQRLFGVSERPSRLTRLLSCLNQGHHVLIFDGLERLLRESDKRPGVGIALNPDIKRFLRIICNRYKSQIILTSRLWPEAFDHKRTLGRGGRNKTIQFEQMIVGYRLEGATFEDVNKGWLPCISGLNDELEIKPILGLLGGHRYALALADAWLKNECNASANLNSAAKQLQLLLSSVAPEHRVSRMIELVVRKLSLTNQNLLDHLSVCMGLVPVRVITICESLSSDVPASVTPSARTLSSRYLLFDMQNDEGETAVSIHPIVRGYVFHRRYQARSDELPNFTLPGFTAGGTHVDPGNRNGAKKILKLFNEIHKLAMQETDPKAALAFCRNAFGIVRSRMEANTSARWDRGNNPDGGPPGEEFLKTVILLADLVRQLSRNKLWLARSGADSKIRVEDAPLWEDELAWLYNEIGLAYYHKGAALDALSVWELEHEINMQIDSNSSGGLYLFQSSCNLGAAFIQLGRLDQAEIHLRTAQRINSCINDEEHGARILGYRGLIEHLRGNFRQAETLYREALVQLERVQFNQRAMSVFERHYADLLLKLNRIDEAERYVISGRARAEVSRYPDIAAHYRLTAGHKWRCKGKIAEAMTQYTAALEEAREFGLRGLEADALSELSRLGLDLGDAQTAAERALESLQIANELCLGLRQVHGLVVLGRSLIRSKNLNLGAAYLREAKARAETQGYWLRAREADEELRELGL